VEQHIFTWQGVAWRVRAGLVVFLLAAVALVVPSQMKDMLADLANFSGGSWPQAIAFHVAMILMAFLLWYWARTVLLATFRIPDTRQARDTLAARAADGTRTVWVFDWLPRLLFLGTALIAAIAALRSENWLQAIIVVLWGISLYWALTHRLELLKRIGFKAAAQLQPERPRASNFLVRLWRRLLDLLDCGPFGAWLATLLLIIAGGLYVVSAGLAFVPGGIAFMTFPAHWFPGASTALLLFGLSVGPLTALTYVLDRVDARLPVFGWTIKLRYFPALTLLTVLIVFGPMKMNLHALRIVEDPAAMTPDARVSLADYFRQWVTVCAPGTGPVRPVIVAVSGGASRAGLWSARVLTMVDRNLASAKDTSIFTVSSVSGGSLGTAAYLAMRAGQNSVPNCRLADLPQEAGDARDQAMVEALRADAIGPALAGTLLGDAPRAIVGVVAAPIANLHNRYSDTPWVFRGNDRAEALERAFEENWQKYGIDKMPMGAAPFGLDAPYLSLFYNAGKLRGFVPAWIANGTDQQKGDRIITAPFKVNQEEFCRDDGRWYETGAACKKHNASYFWGAFGPFLSSLDALSLLKADIPISTAVDNTSRFPFLSPSGELTPAVKTLAKDSAQIIDGGYFENEGLATALEIANWLKTYGPSMIGRPVYPIIVQATADADIKIPAPGTAPSAGDQNAERHIVRCGNARPENPGVGRGEPRSSQLLVPVLGLSAVRTGHSHVALKEAQQDYCGEAGHQAFFDFYLYNGRDFDVPLNWVLSDRVGQFIWSETDGALSACWNAAEQKNLSEALNAAPESWIPGAKPKTVYACRGGKVAQVAIPQLPGPMTGPPAAAH
jgi:hypothetical protein